MQPQHVRTRRRHNEEMSGKKKCLKLELKNKEELELKNTTIRSG